MYADDLQIIVTGKLSELNNMKAKAETVLNNIKTWYDVNGLKVNASKTQCLLIGSPKNTGKIPPNFTILFDNTPIPIESKVKSLGIIIDKHLTFEDHVNSLCSKLNGTLIYTNKVKQNLDDKSRLLIINAIIFSHINYCLPIWGKCSSHLLERIQKCINFAAKVASKGNHTKFDHVTPLLNSLQWLSIHERLVLREATCIFKTLNNHSTAHTLQLPTRKQQSSYPGRSLRNDLSLNTELRRTSKGNKAVSINGPKIWNNIPIDIQNSQSSQTFIKKITASILMHKFNSTDISACN